MHERNSMGMEEHRCGYTEKAEIRRAGQGAGDAGPAGGDRGSRRRWFGENILFPCLRLPDFEHTELDQRKGHMASNSRLV